MGITRKIMEAWWDKVGVMDQKRIDSQTPPSGITTILDIPYIDDGTKPHLLDIYYPEETVEPLPVIIDIHGGGWMYGYKEINKYFNMKLAEKGFLVVSLNYRLAGDYLISDQVHDLFAAFNWLSENLKNYPADMNNIFLAGDSAGGHLTCLSTAVNEDEQMQRDFGVASPGIKFRAAAAICPAVDTAKIKGMGAIMMPIVLGKKPKQSKFYKYMNVSQFASEKMPPFYLVTAEGDMMRKQTYMLEQILKSNGVECGLHDFDDRPNGKKLGHVFNVIDPFNAPGDKANTEICDFFKSKMV